jgi:hypothetical protein
MTVRSQALIVADIAAASSSPAFVCPQGYITLVKSAYYQNVNATAATAQIILNSSAAGFSFAAVNTAVSATSSNAWTGWIALNPGDSISVLVEGASLAMWVSGAVLYGPNQFPIN